ncbi:hypothetical protein TARUN_4961 [Trichoderma arundinaceum]|uniref:Apple domain-containing protein n=1 Tax=Trichoderma arundinaceum TaxID=490622 RepID=A0A395NMG6_TRIAR|nr:hypothetical protein TARUN_4961 [Trichoderma arundinaceum]
MRPLLAGASALLLWASEAAGHAIPAADSNEIVARDQTYRASNGVQFATETGFDYHGGDYKTVTANSFHDCMNACSTQASCRAVSYSGKSCWLKSSVNAATINSKVSGAVRVQYAPSPITCPAAGSNQVKAADGRYFTIQCGVDHPHGDLKSVQTLDFANCISLCDETSGCVAASWRSGTCYLKKSLQAAVANSGVSTAVLTSLLPSPPVFCPGPSGQQFKETSGRTFTISCNVDHPGGDLANKLLSNFPGCVAWCDETKGCVAAVYHDGRCWLKSRLAASSTRPHSQVAVLNSALSPPSSLCPSQNGKQVKEPSGRSYTVACNVDRPGGDLISMKLDSFSSCISWCDQISGCAAAAYHDGQCWLKKTLTSSSAHTNGQVAVLSSKLPQTSTHTTSTTTKKTTSTTIKSTSLSTQKTSTITKSTSASTQSTTSTTIKPSSVSSSVTSVATSSATPISSSSTSSSAATTSSDVATTASTGVTGTAASSNAASTPATASNSPSSATDSPSSASDVSSQTTAPITTGAPAPNGTLQTPTGPLTLAAQPKVTLGPLTPPNVDIAGTAVITPQEVSQLWFGNASAASNASDAINAPTVRVNMTFEYPSVVLDNSVNILNIQCDSGSLSASFATETAYNAAKTSWAAAEGDSSSLIIITAASGCSSDGHYIYFVASQFTFNDSTKSVSCSGSIESVADIAQGVGLDFGSLGTLAPAIQPDPELAATYGCTSPSASNVHGLPAIYCGPDFDYRLDNQLGYYSVADEDFNATLAAVMPGVDHDALESRGLNRRWSLSGAFHAVVNMGKSAVNAIANDAKTLGNAIANTASSLASNAISNAKSLISGAASFAVGLAKGIFTAAAFIVTGNLNFDKSFDFPVNVAPPASALDDSPWGDGFKFYTWTPDKGEFYNAQDAALDKIKGVLIGEADPEPSIELWCVDCHVKGDIKLEGSATYTLSNGISKAQLSMKGNLDASLYLGMNAFAEWDPTKEYDFLTMGLPGLTIPDIFTLGPMISLGVSVDLDISAVGQYLVGADLSWSQLSADLDVINPRSSQQSGWVPNIRDTVQADGSLTVNSTLGLPVTLGFGINILNGKYNKELKVVDTPGVRASLEYDFTNEINNGEVNTDPEDNCYGIHWSLGVVNTVKLDLSDFKQGTYTLEEWDAPVFASGCIGESLSIAPPTATVTAPTGGSTFVPPPPPPSNRDCSSLSCPNDDGTLCVTGGEYFQLNCQVAFSAPFPVNLVHSSGVDECLNDCTSDSNCSGVNWFSLPMNNPLGLGWGSNLPNCWMYGNGQAPSNTPNPGFWTFVKAGTVQRKRDQIVRRATTVATSAVTTSTSTTSTANSKAVVADTLSQTASATTSTAASTTATSTEATASSTATGSIDGPHVISPITITDATGQLLVNPHVNGSLFVSPANSTVSMNTLTNGITFMADRTNPLITGDSSDRILYYFPDTISAVGASRLRLASWDAIPIGAELIMLFPTVASTGETILVALDSTHNIFFPFVCTIEGQLNKIFLVSDAATGEATLTNPDLTYTVIGGIAQSCVSLAMVAEDLQGWSPPKST